MKKSIFLYIITPAISIIFYYLFFFDPLSAVTVLQKPQNATWKIQSIDTMKYSRDLAREKLEEPGFENEIDRQLLAIKKAGANYVAIATPYDVEFLPYLKKWVTSARKNDLRVWFRGNFCGWEGWFDYARISREEHLEKTSSFIKDNPGLFENGDLFSSCPECENGGPGDPRSNGDLEGHREFLIQEYTLSKQAFKSIKKSIQSNVFSMNADVARLVMDKETSKALDRLIVIDHYVASPAQMAKDIDELASAGGSKVLIGEFGAPIPDIHGELDENEKAGWLKKVMPALIRSKNLIGVNYWINTGGSTQLWDEDGTVLPAADTLKKFYSPYIAYGTVKNRLGAPVEKAVLSFGSVNYIVGKSGYFELKFYDSSPKTFSVSAVGYKKKIVTLKDFQNPNTITLKK